MDVINRLAAVILGVDHRPETILGQAELRGYLGDDGHDVSQKRYIIGTSLAEVRDMALGHHEDMDGSRRLYIGESDDMLILI